MAERSTASSNQWREPYARKVAARAGQVYFAENVNGQLEVVTSRALATHYLVSGGGESRIQPFPGATTRMMLIADETLIGAYLEPAAVSFGYSRRYLRHDGSHVRIAKTEAEANRFFVRDGSGYWRISDTDDDSVVLGRDSTTANAPDRAVRIIEP